MKASRWAAVAASVVLAAALSVVAAAPSVGAGPIALSAPSFTGGQRLTGFDENYAPSMSFGSTSTLVVNQSAFGSIFEIVGRIMTPDSTSVARSFVIGDQTASHTDPDVAWNGTSWLVVFQRTNSIFEHDILGQRVGPDGTKVGSPILIAHTGADEANPAVAAGANGQWAVAWDTAVNADTTGRDVYVSRLSAAGVVLDGTGRRASADTPASVYGDVEPDIAWNGAVYLVVWEAQGAKSRIDGAFVAPNGTVSCRCKLIQNPADRPVGAPAVASDGSSFMAAFERNRDGTSTGNDLGIMQVSQHSGGTATVTSATLSAQAGSEEDPAITFNGSYLAVWQDDRNSPGGDIYGSRIGPGLHVVDPDGFLVTNFYANNFSPTLTSGGPKAETFGIAWCSAKLDTGPAVIAYGMHFGPK